MRYRLYMGLIFLFLVSCGKASITAPSDFVISGPSDATDTFSTITPQTPGSSIIYTLKFYVKDANAKARQGVDVTFLLTNGTLCTDSACSTTVTTPYKVQTNDSGVATAYVRVTSPACDWAADASYKVVLSAMLETSSVQWKDSVSVKKCGT